MLSVELIMIWPVAVNNNTGSIDYRKSSSHCSYFQGEIKVSYNKFNACIEIVARVSSYSILMTIQFCLSVILMFATITIAQQKKYMFSRQSGENEPEYHSF